MSTIESLSRRTSSLVTSAEVVASKKVVLYSVVAVIMYLILTPFLFVMWTSLWSGGLGSLQGSLTLQNYVDMYSSAEVYQLFGNTILLTVGMVGTAMFFGVFLAWFIGRTNIPSKDYIETLLLAPMVIPSFLYALVYIFAFSPRAGVINNYLIQFTPLQEPLLNIYSFFGMMFVMGLTSTSTVYLIVIPSLSGMDPSLEEVSRIHGAGMAKTIRQISLPLITPSLASAALISTITGLGAFAVVAILGLRIGYHVFATKIWEVTALVAEPQYGYASALSVTLLVMTGALILVYRWITRKKERYMVVTGEGYRPNQWDLGKWRMPIAAAVWLTLLAIWIVPLTLLLIGSLQTLWVGEILLERFTFEHYLALWNNDRFWKAMRNMAYIAFWCSIIGTVLVTLAAYYTERTELRFRGIVDFFILTPLAFPGVVMGMSILFVYLWINELVGLNILGTYLIIVIGVITGDFPAASRIAVGNIVQIHTELEEIARISGATWARQMQTIFLPLFKGTLGVLVFYLAIASTRALTIPIFLMTSETVPMSVFIFESWFFDANYELTATIAVIFITLMAVVLFGLRFFDVNFHEVL